MRLNCVFQAIADAVSVDRGRRFRRSRTIGLNATKFRVVQTFPKEEPIKALLVAAGAGALLMGLLALMVRSEE